MDDLRRIENLLSIILAELFRLIEIELRPFSEALEDWVNDLLSRRLPDDWRARMHAYLDEQDAKGYIVAPEHRPILENWIESWAEVRGLMPAERPQSDAPTWEQWKQEQQSLTETKVEPAAAGRQSFERLPDGGFVIHQTPEVSGPGPESSVPQPNIPITFADSQSAPEVKGEELLTPHPLNGHVFYWVPPESYISEPELNEAFRIARLSRRVKHLIAEMERELDPPNSFEALGDLLNPFTDQFQQNIDTLNRLCDLRSLFFDAQMQWKSQQYDRIMWATFGRHAQSGLDVAESLVDAGSPHGLENVTVDALMNMADAAGILKSGAKLLAAGGTRLAGHIVWSQGQRKNLAEEAAELLHQVVEEELEKLTRDPSIAQTVLSRGAIAASVDPSIARMHFGRAIERLVRNRIESDFVLRELFEYHGRRRGPDFLGIGRFEGLRLELTTPGQVAAHRARSYGADLIIVTYPRPAIVP